jgi:predicted ATPase/DNA-binding winged helix-turn-helix (wHTH) protein
VSTDYELGPFRLDPEVGVLSHGGRPTALGSRAVAVLAALVKQPNVYVRKESIMEAAWPGVVVEESNLAVQISSIRRVLAQASGGEHWVETLARRGYRFVGPVTELDDNVPHGAPGGRQRTNLPESLTSFVGRERELVEIKRLLPDKRLLTLVGVGGIGKTRLALQAAAEVMDAYRDGVWLVELGSIRDPLLVPTSVAQVLGVQERAGTPLADTLCAYLKSRQLLLILDNCEHLLEACAMLADSILRAGSQPTIMATSREPLHATGEQTYPLQPLSLPDPSAGPEAMARSEAVQLLVERIKRQLPDFELTAARAPAIAELCIHLDGIPLALELAAARARSLSIEQINTRLNDRFKLLTSRSRTALPRQQTLRATLDWSYDLLSEDERSVLRRLSIFPGSFTLEAASAVASDAAIDEFAVIDLLSQLVARSLIVANIADRGARYRFLETTRAYVSEKLAETAETEACQRRHAEYFRDLFERAPDDWARIADADWRATYGPELDNVHVALDWALDAGGDTAIGIGLAVGSAPLWLELVLGSEGPRRLQTALAAAGSHTSEADQAALWSWLGYLSWREPHKSLEAHERALDLYRGAGDLMGIALALVRLGGELAHTERVEQAAPLLAEALPLLERLGPSKALAEYFVYSGHLKMHTGDLVGARMNYEKAASLSRQTGAEGWWLAALSSLAEIEWQAGELDAALATYNEAVALTRKSLPGRKRTLSLYLTNLAGVHTERGELDAALAAAREGLELWQESGYAWFTLDHLALRVALGGKLASAARIAGYTDSAHAANAAARQPNEARARARLQTLLRAKLAPDELERLLAEGAKMSEDEACRLALEE